MDSILKYKSSSTANELKAKVFGSSFVNPKNRFIKLEINDVPIMITNENEILCVPNINETKHIGFTGMTGTSKSLALNSLLSWDQWHVGNSCLILNDMQKETFEWSLPAISYKFILDRLHIEPCPTPIVYVFPSTKTLEIEGRDERFPIMKMSMPLQEAILNVKNYWSLDKSEVYLKNLVDDLVECSSMSEIISVIEENLSAKSQSSIRFKLINIFESFFNNQIIDASAPDAPAYLRYEDKYGNEYNNLLFQTLMYAGFVPSIQTTDLMNQDYFSAYMAFIVDALYRNQYEDPYFRNKKVSLFVDEIDKLWKGKDGELIKNKLNLVGTNGRAARIGLRWSTQHYDQVPEQIRGNTKYLFISRKSNAKEVNEIRKDFDIPKSMDKDILGLTTDPAKGIFEIVAVTTERFVVYDLETGVKKQTSLPRKGFLIPPMARHRIPGIQI
jgi:hypothetical protein